MKVRHSLLAASIASCVSGALFQINNQPMHLFFYLLAIILMSMVIELKIKEIKDI